MGIFNKIFKSYSEKEVKRVMPLVEKINGLEDEISKLTDEQLKNKTNEFKIFGDNYDTKDGTCVRDYINVEDLAYAHKLVYEYLLKENKSDVFNLGTQNGYSVKEVFETCQQILNKKINYKIENRREDEPAILYADISKLRQVLNWQPKQTFEHSIKTSYEWEKMNELSK